MVLCCAHESSSIRWVLCYVGLWDSDGLCVGVAGHKRWRKRVLYLYERYFGGYIFVPFYSYLEGGVKFFVGLL